MMATMTEERHLFESFAARSERRGDEFYFDRAAALDFVQACDDNDFAIIGIECFWLTSHATVPEPSLIADYSSDLGTTEWRAFKSRNNNNARRFVSAAPGDVFFAFVIEPPLTSGGGSERSQDL